MQSKAPKVSAYMAELPQERRVALAKLRALCRRSLKGCEECMAYGMPAYKSGTDVVVAFASQKQHISLYVLQYDVLNRHRKSLSGCTIGKGCIRYSRPEHIDFDSIADLLRDVAKSTSEPC
ncbi:MAG TPA: DUF1801 domain-containing protein [Terriglobales bacterium]|nr:DUF1801 domain-containing protein [Terriglobales bacterium]